MLRPAVILLLAILAPACSLMPAKSEYVRAQQMEDAVLPMAATALEAGQVETARRLYVRLLDVDPESVRARMGLGDVALRERETAAAARWYLAALAHTEAPLQRHAALLAHGRAALAAGQLKAARESFTRLTNPKENAPRESVAWGHNGMGLTLLLEGDLTGAVAAMERAVLHVPEEERFQGNLNRALAMLGGYPSPESTSPGELPFADVTGDFEIGNSAAPSREDKEAPAIEREGNAESAHRDDVPDTTALAETDMSLTELISSAEAEFEETEGPLSQQEEADVMPLASRTDLPLEADGTAAIEPDYSEDPSLQAEESKAKAFEPEVEPEPQPHTSVEVPIRETEPLPQKPDELEVTELIVTVTPEPVIAADVEVTDVQQVVSDGQAQVPAAEPASHPIEPAFGEGGQSAVVEDSSTGSGTPSSLPRVFVVSENSLSFLQFGAYAKPANADAVALQLSGFTEQPVQISIVDDMAGTLLHRVRIGPVPSEDALLDLISVLETHGYRITNLPRSSSEDVNHLARAQHQLKTFLIHKKGGLFLQAGAYSERANAESLATQLRGLTERPVRISEVVRENRSPLHRVRVGPLAEDDPFIALFEPGE